MIIAPLSTPIMGIALGIVNRQRRGATRFVLFGGLLVIGVGVLFSAALPGSYDLLGNSQIASRTSPGLLDVIAAVATGFAGAVALARRDVAAVLPGVAIAISLVPPLAVVGVCLGQGAGWLAVGALLLFLSNLLALVLAGTVVYAGPRLRRRGDRPRQGPSPRPGHGQRPLPRRGAAPGRQHGLHLPDQRVDRPRPDDRVDVDLRRAGRVGHQRGHPVADLLRPGQDDRRAPAAADLLEELDGQVPDGLRVVVDSRVGQQLDVGIVGQ